MRVVVPGGPEEAWARFSDVASWPEWNPHCAAADVDGAVRPGAVLDLRLRHPRGREFITRPRVTECVPARSFSWEARGLGLRAATTTRFSREPDGTLITLDSRTSGPLSLTYRMTMTDRTLAIIYTRMLDALVEDLRP